MRLRLFSLLIAPLVAGAAFAQAPALPAGSAHYTLIEANDGKTLGSADFVVQALPNGYAVVSRGSMNMAKFSYSFTNTNRLDPQLNIVRDQLTGTVNGSQVTFNLASDSTGRQFHVNITAQGKNTTNTFDRHLNTVLLPDLDPAAYLEMAHLAAQHPQTAWVIIPKQNGIEVPARYLMQADVQATWQGRSIFVNHTTVEVSAQNGITVEIYSTSDGQVMETDLPEQNFYVIRDGFRLSSRPHYEPPHGTAPPNPNQQQNQPQNQ